jgi:HPt (histidine-containing phosphotransfer) domain-containing protein
MDPVDKAKALERIDNDVDLYDELIEIFLEDTPAQIEKLGAALSAGDDQLALRQAHSIKSAAANLGAEKMRSIAFLMEDGARTGGVAKAAPHFGELAEEFVRVQDFFAAYRRERGGTN